MALIIDPDNLSQGASLAVTDAVFTVGSPLNVAVITSGGAGLPVLTAGEFFEVRDHTNGQNNGLYQEIGGTPTTSSVTARKITGSNPVTAGSTAIRTLGNSSGSPIASTQKSVHFATGDRDIYVLEQGYVNFDGVTEQAVYSFAKEEWKADDDLIPFPFPMVAITPEQFELQDNWNYADDETGSPQAYRTRKLIRTGGWSELNTAGDLLRQYAGIISLGSFAEATDRAYYATGNDPTDTGAAVDFTFEGPVNEAVLIYERVVNDPTLGLDFTTSTITRNDGGSFITDGFRVGGQVTVSYAGITANDGTYTLTGVSASVLTVQGTPFTITGSPNDRTAWLAVDNRNRLNVYLREGFSVGLDPDSGKTYQQAGLSDIGVSTLSNQVYRFPLSNSADLKVLTADATVSTRSPTVTITYHATPQILSGFNAAGGSTQSPNTEAAFGIVIDAKGLSLEEVYEYVQYRLKSAVDINDDVGSPTGGAVTGNTADALLRFVGDNLGTLTATNPNGGGTGVAIINFSAADTNRLSFVDNDGLTRSYPFVAAGTISFNENLQVDAGPAEYIMFFQYTTRTAVSDLALSGVSGSDATLSSPLGLLPVSLLVGDYITLSGFTTEANNGVWLVTSVTASPQSQSIGVQRYDSTLTIANEGPVSGNVDTNPIDSPDAIVVNSATTFSPLPIRGNVVSASVSYDFDYDGNSQGGRTPGTDAAVIVRAIGTDKAQPVEATGTIARTTTNNFTLVAPLERNYSNPV